MSINSTEPTKTKAASRAESLAGITWSPWTGVLVAVVIYFLALLIGAQLTALIFVAHAHDPNWLSNSVTAQFVFTLLAEILTVGLLIWFVRWRKGKLEAIGLKRPKLIDPAWALVGWLIYFPLYLIAVGLASGLFKLNLNQQQSVGFSGATGGWQLAMTFISLVVLPPIAEEIMFRGFLYSGLKKALPKIWAVIITGLLFAAPHLPESASGGVIWVLGIDTFILSVVLCWLRDKTGRLYAGMGLHALKNFIAFAAIFIFHVH